MNHMKQVAQMLGVELEEEFKVEGYPDGKRYRLTRENLELFYDGKWCIISGILTYLLSGKYNAMKIPKPILTEEEKEYLSYVIKPFRDSVEYIIKNSAYCPVEWIIIKYKDGQATSLPQFEKGTMYKGMELVKEYTLEELGL